MEISCPCRVAHVTNPFYGVPRSIRAAILGDMPIAAVSHWFAATRWHWRAWQFALVPIGLAVLISVAAFAQNMAFKVEATGEVMIIALGYGVLMPLLAQRSERVVAPVSHA